MEAPYVECPFWAFCRDMVRLFPSFWLGHVHMASSTPWRFPALVFQASPLITAPYSLILSMSSKRNFLNPVRPLRTEIMILHQRDITKVVVMMVFGICPFLVVM